MVVCNCVNSYDRQKKIMVEILQITTCCIINLGVHIFSILILMVNFKVVDLRVEYK